MCSHYLIILGELLSFITTKIRKKVRASNNNTGNLEVGGDWIMESHMENVVDLYFNDNIKDWGEYLYHYGYGHNTTGSGVPPATGTGAPPATGNWCSSSNWILVSSSNWMVSSSNWIW